MNKFFFARGQCSALTSGSCMALPLIVLFGSVSQLAWADEATSTPTLPRPDMLAAGDKMLPGEYITSRNGTYTFNVQSDGNLVVYSGATALWSSQTWGNSDVSKLTMQLDGNLVLTRNSGGIIWQSNTGGTDPSNNSYFRYLMVTDSGKLVIHGDAGRPAWSGAVRHDAVRFYSRGMRNYSGKPMCMDVTDALTSNGTNIQLWDCNGFADGDAQAFVYNASDQSIRMRSNPNKCVDLSGGNTSSGTNVQIWDCNGTNAQKFVYDAVSGAIIVASDQAKCIDISGVRSATNLNGTNIRVWDCNGTGAQQFDMAIAAGTGIPIWVSSTSLVKRDSTNKCIDISGGGTTNGTKIQLWDCHGGAAQIFEYNKIAGTIKMVNNNKCMDLSAGNTANGTKIQLWDCTGGENQRFDYDFNGGQIRFRKTPSKCVDVAGNSNGNGTNIQLHDCNNSSAQSFNLSSQLQRLSIDLNNVDDDVYVYVNGTQRLYFNSTNPGLQDIAESWLRYGDNEINVVLGNYGCYASSLGISLYRNMEVQPAMMRSVYLATTLNCGYQADWRYSFNTATGRIRQTQ
ncbi:RICIN domain-containing protein [Sorangium sp. So ce1128]